MKNAARMPSGRTALTRKARIFSLVRNPAAGLAAVAALMIVPGGVAAEPGALPSLAGAWSGSGWVSFSSGSKERARCKIRYAAQTANTFRLSGMCATESGRVSQTATVRKAGGNAYAGSFYNSEYDISGSIYIVMRGNSHTATLRSSSGSAVLTFSR